MRLIGDTLYVRTYLYVHTAHVRASSYRSDEVDTSGQFEERSLQTALISRRNALLDPNLPRRRICERGVSSSPYALCLPVAFDRHSHLHCAPHLAPNAI